MTFIDIADENSAKYTITERWDDKVHERVWCIDRDQACYLMHQRFMLAQTSVVAIKDANMISSSCDEHAASIRFECPQYGEHEIHWNVARKH